MFKDSNDESTLVPIKLNNGVVSTQPMLESTYNTHPVMVLSVREYDGNIMILETNPYQTDIDVDWEPVLWDSGTAVIFTANGDAVLPVCNQFIRVRIAAASPVMTAQITLK
jgi:hypothetical protein